jgi:hypothetical protein
MTAAPGTDTAAYLGYTLLEHLIKLLISKGVITDAERVTLLNQAIDDIGKQPRSIGKLAIDHIKNTMLP